MEKGPDCGEGDLVLSHGGEGGTQSDTCGLDSLPPCTALHLEAKGFAFLTNPVSLAEERDSYSHQVRIMYHRSALTRQVHV